MNNLQFSDKVQKFRKSAQALSSNTLPYHLDVNPDYWRSPSFSMVNHSSNRVSSHGLCSTRS